MSDFDSIIYEVADGRARITLNRPEKLNALSLKLQSELNEALWEADNNTDVYCVILRGAGRACARSGTDATASRCGNGDGTGCATCAAGGGTTGSATCGGW